MTVWVKREPRYGDYPLSAASIGIRILYSRDHPMRVITKVFITLIVSVALTACQSGSTDSANPTATNATADTSEAQSNTAPTISGNPATSVVEGENYSFSPIATDVDGDNLTFNVANLPAWASFDTASGTISGTPGNAAFMAIS